jgi:hypothetical protein
MNRELAMAMAMCLGSWVFGCGDDDGHHEDGGHGHDAGEDASLTEAQALCNCLLVTCHDAFHDQYGEGDAVAIPACELDTDGLPSAGMEVSSGDFIECRHTHCEMAETDETLCAAALGATPCQ